MKLELAILFNIALCQPTQQYSYSSFDKESRLDSVQDSTLKFHYWACVSRRSVEIKTSENDGISRLSSASVTDCLETCSEDNFALFSEKYSNCYCISSSVSNFQIYPSDIGHRCNDTIDEYCVPGGDDYALYCKGMRDHGSITGPCTVISSPEAMTDPLWNVTENDERSWRPWMNGFPKCVHVSLLQSLPLRKKIIKLKENKSLVEQCDEFATPRTKYTLLQPTGVDNQWACYLAGNEIFLGGDEFPVNDLRQCEPCPDDPNLTCGSQDRYFSIYCQDIDCQRYEHFNHKTALAEEMYYFGCFERYPGWNDMPFERLTVEECFETCLNQTNDGIFMMTHRVETGEGSVECRCRKFAVDNEFLNYTMRDMKTGCHIEWGPPVGGPAGYFLESAPDHYYSLYCRHDVSEMSICRDFLQKDQFISKPREYPCERMVSTTDSTTAHGTLYTLETSTSIQDLITTENAISLMPTATTVDTTLGSTTTTTTTTTTITSTTTTTTTTTTATTTTTITTTTTTTTTSTTTTTTTTSTSTTTTTTTTTTSSTSTSGTSISSTSSSTEYTTDARPPTNTTLQPICPEMCSGRIDERGFPWDPACPGQVVKSEEKCTDIADGVSGYATWTCDKETAQWTPMQPDRTFCGPEWVYNLEEAALTEGSSPLEIVHEMLAHVNNYDGMESHITSGTLVKMIEIGLLLPTRMNDSVNSEAYFATVAHSLLVAEGFVQVTADLFHHTLAWLEADSNHMVSNATTLMQANELISFFPMEVAQALERNLTSVTLSDKRKEVFAYLNMIFNLDGVSTVEDLPVPPYIRLNHIVDSNGLVNLDKWHALGITYNISFLTETLFNPSLNTFGQDAWLEFDTKRDLQGFSLNNHTKLPEGVSVEIVFEYENNTAAYVMADQYCVFWNETLLLWSTEGCRHGFIAGSNITVCQCEHTTNFGILFDISGALDDKLSDTAQIVLEVMSLILCSFSTLCCLLTFMVLVLSKLPSSPRVVIQKNRALSLFFLYLLFLIGIDPAILGLGDAMCVAVAILIHFFGLSVFFWTALEGVQLYKSVIKMRVSDVDTKFSQLLRYVLGYGLSLFVVAVTLGVSYALDIESAYFHGSDDSLCWLKEGTFIWAFAGPAAIVILFNIVIMFLTIRATRRARETKLKHNSNVKQIVSHLKSWFILTFLLGITWSIGFLVQGDLVRYTTYVFVLMNGSTGIFIFVHSVLLNGSIRAELTHRLRTIGLKCSKKEHEGGASKFGFNYGGHRGAAVTKRRAKNTRLREPRTSEYSTSTMDAPISARGLRSHMSMQREFVIEEHEEPSTPEFTSVGGSQTSSDGSCEFRPRII